MIELINVTKYYMTDFGRHYVFRHVSLLLPLDKSVAVIGPNGAGKSTFLRLIAGSDIPSEGVVRRTGRISPPMGLTPSIQASLNAVENARFAGRIYGLNRDETNDMIDHVRQVANIGKFFDMPVFTYSSGMRQRVSFAINMCLDFDYYIFDEVSAGGDREFRKMSQAMVEERLKTSKFVLASHRKDELADLCESGIVIQNGELKFFDDVRDALAYYGDDEEDEKPARKARQARDAKGGEDDNVATEADLARKAARTQMARARLERIKKVKDQRQTEANVRALASPSPGAVEDVAADPASETKAIEAHDTPPTEVRVGKLKRQHKLRALIPGKASDVARPETATVALPAMESGVAAADRARGLARRAFLSQEEAEVKATRALGMLLLHLDAATNEDPKIQQHRVGAALAAQRTSAIESAKARRMLETALSYKAASESQALEPPSLPEIGITTAGPVRTRKGA